MLQSLNNTFTMQLARRVALGMWALAAFFTPLGTAPTILFSYIAIFSTILVLRPVDYKRIFDAEVRSITVPLLAFFCLLALSVYWTIAPQSEWIEALSKYRRLLAALLLYALLTTTPGCETLVIRSLLYGSLAYILGVLMTTSGAWYILLGAPGEQGWPIGPRGQHHWLMIGKESNPTFGKNHISAGLILNVVIFYYTARLFDRREKKYYVYFLWALFIAVALWSVFSIDGRTGYLLFCVGLVYLFSSKYVRSRLEFRSFLLIGATLCSVLYLQWANFEPRVLEAATDVRAYISHGEMTSQGVRLEFWMKGLLGTLENSPLLGFGVGSYSELYALMVDAGAETSNRQIMELAASRPQPHSEVVITLAQSGLVGLSLTIYLYCALFKRLSKTDRLDLRLLWLVFLFDGLFNSVIFDLTEGQVFVVLMGFSLVVIRSGPASKSTGLIRNG